MDVRRALGADVGKHIGPALAVFSAVHLATSEFIRNSYPSSTLIAVPASVIAKMVLIFQVMPFVILYAIDLWLLKRYSARAVRRYRAILFGATGVLVLRQIELHLTYIEAFASNVQAYSPLLYTAIAAGAVVSVVWLAVRYTPAVGTYLSYFAPVAVGLSLMMTQLTADQNAYYEGYDVSEVESRASDKPPVYIIIFDELSYDALLDSKGEIDSVRYPNFARLGRESLHLTNATTNYFRTRFIIPEITDSVLTLSNRYEVRLYEQAHRIELLYAHGCGTEYTCRGARYMLGRNSDDLIAYLGMRAGYDALPGWLEGAARLPLRAAVKAVGSPPPPSDPLGFHQNSVAIVEQYLDDISAEGAFGRVFLLHTLLPHYPFVYDDHGEFEQEEHVLFPRIPIQRLSPGEYEDVWNHYRDQIAYTDRLLGEFFSRLDEERLYDRSVIIVTSDHGLRPITPVWGKPIEIDSLPTRVPMFIHAPEITPRVSDIDYQHVDFGATILDVLGYEFVERAIDGSPIRVKPISALSEERPERVKELYVDYADTLYWRYVQYSDSVRWVLDETVEVPLVERKPSTDR